MTSARARVVFLAVLLWLSPVPLRADSNADEAEARFQQGASLYRDKRYQDALLEFFASHRLVPNRNVVFNIARTYEALGRYDEAYRYYNEYLAAERDPGERRTAEAKLVELAPRVALLSVTTVPAGATVYIDRKDLGGRGETPLTLALPQGPHQVLVERAGHEPHAAQVELVVGRAVPVTLALVPILGTVVVTSVPPAELRVDRLDDDHADPDATTPTRLALPPGRHSVELRAPGHRPRRRELQIEPRIETTIAISLETIPPPSGTVAVQASEPGALVLLDGIRHGVSPVVLTPVVGVHVVEVRKDGYAPWIREIAITEGARSFLEASLRPEEPEVVGATRTAQRLGDAPASVSLVAGDEISALGYETVAEALRGVRGLYATDDRNYAATGIRGFSPVRDYTTRVLVTRDGHVLNDDWVGAGFVGRDFAVDLEDVERIEVVRGPGSAYYGPGAFFGVVNVVTVPPGKGSAAEMGAAATSTGGTRAHARTRLTLFSDLSLSASGGVSYSQGQSFEYPAFKDTPSAGFVTDSDGEDAQHLSLRFRAGDLSLDAGWNRRAKDVPTASYSTVFDPRHFALTGNVITRTLDTRTFVDGRFARTVGGARLELILTYDRSFYDGRWPYAADGTTPAYLLYDYGITQWGGGEARLTLAMPGRQSVTMGLSAARHEVRQGAKGPSVFEDERDFTTGSLYLVDSITPSSRLALNLGVRLDRAGPRGDHSLTPRAAAILRAYEGGTTKLIFGRAFRAPSAYELYYNDGEETQKAALVLDPETVWTAELEHTHALDDRTYVVASLFGNHAQHLVQLVTDPSDKLFVFRNSSGRAQSVGAELEAKRTWRSGAWILGALSYAYLRSDDEADRINSAPLTGLLKAYLPASSGRAGLASELVYNAPRRDREGGLTDTMLLVNLVASGRVGTQHLRFRVGVYNLLDWDYSLPMGDEHVPLTLAQDGRSFLLHLAYEQ
jgi:outer membrane receptor protein involved in Fe transport